MKSIPGAITALAGVGLLAVTCFANSQFALKDLFGNASLVVGLVLCTVGLFALACPALNDTEVQPIASVRFRFSIRDLLWFTVVVAALVAWSLDHQVLAEKVPTGPSPF